MTKMEEYILKAERGYAEKLAAKTRLIIEEAELGRSFRQEAERLLLPVIDDLNRCRRARGELEFRLDCLCMRARGIWFGLLYEQLPFHEDWPGALEDGIDLPGLELFVQCDERTRPLFLRIRPLVHKADYSSEKGTAFDVAGPDALERIMWGIAEEITESGL